MTVYDLAGCLVEAEQSRGISPLNGGLGNQLRWEIKVKIAFLHSAFLFRSFMGLWFPIRLDSAQKQT